MSHINNSSNTAQVQSLVTSNQEESKRHAILAFTLLLATEASDTSQETANHPSSRTNKGANEAVWGLALAMEQSFIAVSKRSDASHTELLSVSSLSKAMDSINTEILNIQYNPLDLSRCTDQQSRNDTMNEWQADTQRKNGIKNSLLGVQENNKQESTKVLANVGADNQNQVMMVTVLTGFEKTIGTIGQLTAQMNQKNN